MKAITSFLKMPALLVLLMIPAGLSAQIDLTPKGYFDRLMKITPEDVTKPSGDQLPGTPPAHISPQDFLWRDWLKRTGELPPDFDQMPSLPFLPDPLIIDEGGKNIPVETIQQWQLKRSQIREQAQRWITGTIPPPPGNITVEVLEEKMFGQVKERNILLRFGPDHKAQLHVSLLIPPGKGPFPVFLCQWQKNRYDWVQAAVRRGYIGCRITATDPKYGYPDDSEAYEELYWPQYDFSALMRWGWAASRAIDYLYTLDNVNKKRGEEGNTLLMMMAKYGTAEHVRMVINKGGDVNIKDNNGYTALMYAVERGNPKIIELLKNAGAKEETFIDEEKRDFKKLKETITKNLERMLEAIDDEATIRGLTAQEIESRKNMERERWAKIEQEEIEKLERKYR